MDFDEIKAVLLKPRPGFTAKVVKGRKHTGAIGRIIWAGDTTFGASVKMREASGNEFFISQANIEVYFPGLNEGEEPEGGWDGLYSEWLAAFPKKGDEVVLGGSLGTVFWVSDEGARIGVHWKTATKAKKFMGSNEDGIQRIEPDGSRTTYLSVVATPHIPGNIRENLKSQEKSLVDVIRDFPDPFNQTVEISKTALGWVLKDARGEDIACIPQEELENWIKGKPVTTRYELGSCFWNL